MSAATSTGALPINPVEQGKEDLTDGQEKSLMENLTSCCMGQQQQEGAKNEETAGNLKDSDDGFTAESPCPVTWGSATCCLDISLSS